MFDRTYQQLHQNQQQAQQKISKLERQKAEAIQQRIKQLAQQLKDISYENSKYNKGVEEARTNFQQFKAKNKTLYKKIYQGARQLDLRKKVLIEDIKGVSGTHDNYQ